MTNLEIAIAWIERGRRVFPCWNEPTDPRSHKAPMGNLVERGVIDATNDADVVCDWWSRYPNALVGVAGGDGLVLVDLDDKTPERGKGTEAWLALGGVLEGDNVVRTKSGGYHLYFSGDAPNSKDTLAGGLEIRCRNQYVIAWSVVEQWPAPPLPDFLTKKIYESRQASSLRRSSQRVLASRYDLVGAFEAENWYLGEVGRDGKHAVICPWHDQHGEREYKADTTVIFEPEAEGKPWGFKCNRSSCDGVKRVKDVIRFLARKHPQFFTDGVLTDAQFDGDGYEYKFDDGIVEIRASRLMWSGEDLFAEVTVKDHNENEYGELAPTLVSLKRLSSRNELVRTPVSAHPQWDSVWNEFCRKVIAAQRGSDTGVVDDLRSVELMKESDEMMVITPLLPALPKGHLNIWFSDGGVGKSVLALYAAGLLAQQGKRVLYLDWEMDAATHRARLRALFGDDEPPVAYRHCEDPLPQMADWVRRRVREHSIELVVVDSIVWACGGDPLDANIPRQYQAAVRRFGTTSLHLAHVSKGNSKSDSWKMKPFGSNFWHASGRTTWFMETAEQNKSETAFIKDLALLNRKSNFGALENDMRIRFHKDHATRRITYQEPPAPFVGNDQQQVKQSTAALITQILDTRGPMDRETLKAAMVAAGVKPKSFSTALNREIKAGTFVEHNGLIHVQETE